MMKLSNIHVTLLGEGNYPIHVGRVDTTSGALESMTDLDKFLAAARKVNPELGLNGIIKAIIREGVHVVTKQIADGKPSAFLKNRRE